MAPEYLPAGASVTRVRPLLHLLRAQLEQYAAGAMLALDRRRIERGYALRAQCVAPRCDCRRWPSTFPVFAMHSRARRRTRHRRSVCSTNWRVIDMEAAARDDRPRAVARRPARTRRRPRAQSAALLDALAGLAGGVDRASRRRFASIARGRRAGEGHSLRVDHAGQALRSYRGQIYWEAGDSAEPADETALAARAVSELAWQGESIWRLPQWRGTFVFAEANADDPGAVPAALLRTAPL